MPGRLSAYAFILSGAVVLAVASALAGAQSQMRPPAPDAMPMARGPVAPPAPVKPYKPLAVIVPRPLADSSFAAFRKDLADIAGRKDRSALARRVAANFFWMSTRGDRASRKKPAIDNLAAAIDLDDTDGSGWEAFAGMARAATLGTVAVPGRQAVMCAPAPPAVDQKALLRLLRETGTHASAWVYPAQAGLEVKAEAQAPAAPDAESIEKLGLHLVRVLPDEPSDADASRIKVVTPAGKTGYVAADAVSPLVVEQLCYAKDNGWKIAGVAGGE